MDAGANRSNFVVGDGDGYERQMGRWSQRLAVPLAEFAGDGPYAAFVATLGTESRAELAKAVRRAYLSGMADGPRSFSASAWAVKGRA